MSGRRVLSGRRAAVEACPREWAFPTPEYDARYDSPTASGGRSRCPSFSASLSPWSTGVCRFQPRPVSGVPLPCLQSGLPYTKVFHRQERLGPPQCCHVSLPACHGLRTPADLPPLANTGGLGLPAGCGHTLGVRNKRPCAAVPALQGTRLPLRPPGYAGDASPILFAVSPRLRHGRKTRYGWVATPSPTGTFTLQETPSLSWRKNAGAQPLPEAGATQERTLEAVRCSAWFGVAWGQRLALAPTSRPLPHRPRPEPPARDTSSSALPAPIFTNWDWWAVA
jgi:hypothetical protein